jgi:hypothetical protein
VDHWGSESVGTFVAMTAHFIDDDWKLRRIVLGFDFMIESYYSLAEDIVMLVKHILEAYGIVERDVVVIVTDTAAHMARVPELIDCPHRYFVDNLFEMTTNILGDRENCPEAAAYLNKAEIFVDHFKDSEEANEQLMQLQRQFGVEHPVSVSQDVGTRYLKSFEMIDRLRSLRHYITLLHQGRFISRDLDEDTWMMLSDWHNMLEPFQEVHELLENEKHVTASLSLLCVQFIFNSMKDFTHREHQGSEAICDMLFADFLQRWSEPEELEEPQQRGSGRSLEEPPKVLLLAMAMDPRMKSLEHCDPALRDNVWGEVLNELNALEESPAVAGSSNGSQAVNFPPVSNSLSFGGPQPHKEPRRRLMDFFGGATSAPADELRRYQQFPNQKLHNDDSSHKNPLDWWQQNKEEFPRLAKLARKYLSIPATSAAAGKVFSPEVLNMAVASIGILHPYRTDMVMLNAAFQQPELFGELLC